MKTRIRYGLGGPHKTPKGTGKGRKTYLENLEAALIGPSDKARKVTGRGQGEAWNNVKKKTALRHRPRGPFFKRFFEAEHSRKGHSVLNACKEVLAEASSN